LRKKEEKGVAVKVEAVPILRKLKETKEGRRYFGR